MTVSTAGFPRRLWHLRHTLKPPTVSPLSKATLPRAPARRWSATQRWSKGFDRARRHRATRGARPRRPRCAQRSCRPRCGDSARAWPPRQSPSRRDAQTRPRVALSRRERERYIYIYIYIRFADICIRFGDTRDVVLFGVIRRKYVLDSILSLVTAPARLSEIPKEKRPFAGSPARGRGRGPPRARLLRRTAARRAATPLRPPASCESAKEGNEPLYEGPSRRVGFLVRGKHF